jgi:hypothetical protein
MSCWDKNGYDVLRLKKWRQFVLPKWDFVSTFWFITQVILQSLTDYSDLFNEKLNVSTIYWYVNKKFWEELIRLLSLHKLFIWSTRT